MFQTLQTDDTQVIIKILIIEPFTPIPSVNTVILNSPLSALHTHVEDIGTSHLHDSDMKIKFGNTLAIAFCV